MEVDGRKIQVIVKDDQLKPDLAKAALEQAYGDDKVDIAVGTTSSAAALAMLPVAEEYKKVLIVEPAVADQHHRRQVEPLHLPHRAQLHAGRAGRRRHPEGRERQHRHARPGLRLRHATASRRLKEALAAVGSKAKIVHEEYAPQTTTDFTAPRAAHLRRAEGQARPQDRGRSSGPGAHPLPKLDGPQARALRHRARARRQHPAGDGRLEAVRRHSKAPSITTTASPRTR